MYVFISCERVGSHNFMFITSHFTLYFYGISEKVNHRFHPRVLENTRQKVQFRTT